MGEFGRYVSRCGEVDVKERFAGDKCQGCNSLQGDR